MEWLALKLFDLVCDSGHCFEGWFASVDDIEKQSGSGRLLCPICDSLNVQRKLSVPHLGLNRHDESQSRPEAAPQDPPEPTPRDFNAFSQALALRIAKEVIAQTEDVGDRFAEEARRIYYQESSARGIRGIASVEEAETLVEEGINVMRLPFRLLKKERLQ